MDNEEYVQAQRVIAEGNTTLAVQALKEANEELQGEIEFLKQENARLRNHNRVVTAMRRQISGKALDLMKQVEEMGQHIMNIAAEEDFVDGEPPIESYPNIQFFEGSDGTPVPLQKRDSDTTPASV